jgi:hypothetical protein
VSDGLSLIERDREKALNAMRAAYYPDGLGNIGAMLDAALDSGALAWASNHRGAVEAFAQERQAVLDCVNLYGDETLHKALDAIGWPDDYIGGSR